jgi:hypothetical protein
MNSQLQKLREQHDATVRRFQEEKSSFEKQKQSELENMRRLFAEERKKIELERRNLVKQHTVNQMLPSKRFDFSASGTLQLVNGLRLRL